MRNSPRATTSTKRKCISAVTPPRKRVKIAIDVPSRSERSISRRPKNDQQTLTQIDFVRSASFDRDGGLDAADLMPLPVSGTSTMPRPKNERRLRKRNSTLTQMGFFGGAAADIESIDDTMIRGNKEAVEELPRTPTMATRTIHPRRSATRTTRSASGTTKAPVSAAVKQVKSLESQEQYQGRRRRNPNTEEPVVGENRRRSGRIAAVTKPQPTYHHEQENLVIHLRDSESKQPLRSRPVLEIQDSTELDEPLLRSADNSGSRSVLLQPPVTPKKERDRVPSSQTPESISLSHRKSKKPAKQDRPPLADLSTNVWNSGGSEKLSLSKHKSSKSPQRKICVLKIPQKAFLPRSSRVDDSQHDIWSIQATSSPRKKGSSQIFPTDFVKPLRAARTPKKQNNGTGETVSIKESSNAQEVDTQQFLPDVSVMFSLPPQNAPQSLDRAKGMLAGVVSEEVDKASEESKQGSDVENSDEMLLDQEPVNMIPEVEDITTDELSDSGSLTANDTQFVRTLNQRVPLPLPPSSNESRVEEDTAAGDRTALSPITSTPTRASLPPSPIRRTPLPAPKLVSTSPVRTVQRQTTTSSTLSKLLSLSHQSTSFRNVTTTRVPLNDTAEYQQSSSSPALPPAPIPAQKSVYPASIPHPSQISTQAASTQGYFPISSMPQMLPAPQNAEMEHITIKDSSSAPVRMTQLRQHDVAEDDFAEGQDIKIMEELQDADDLDLDPSTPMLRAASTRKLKIRGKNEPAMDDEETHNVTQTPTQRSRKRFRSSQLQRLSSTQETPIIIAASTRAQREAKLDVIALTSSPIRGHKQRVDENNMTPRPIKQGPVPRQTSSADAYEAKGSGKIASTNQTKRTGRDRNKPLHVDIITRHQPSRLPNPDFSSSQSSAPRLSTPNRHNSTSATSHELEPSPISSISSTSYSSTPPRGLKRKFSPIAGFDNDTQSDFTQNGTITAAYVHRMTEEGLLPRGVVPKPFRAKNFREGGSRKLHRDHRRIG